MCIKQPLFLIALVCLIVGMMFAVQYKTTLFYKQSLVPERIEDLTSRLNSIDNKCSALEESAANLNQQLEKLRNSDKVMAEMQKTLQTVRIAGGLAAAEGAGVRINIGDMVGSLQSSDNSSGENGSFADFRDLLLISNELRASGAEALSINDQRLTAMSEITWTGTMVVVNGNRITPPYKIQAIGDSNILESGMSLVGGYLYKLQATRSVELKKVDSIKMPGFNGPSKMVYAEPVK